ncbi:PspC domain-containing protein [Conexibacter arvalis]|uniref:Phage shock protein PspC (Stress-responsive transcriptional regulator) n=1 Tax=Conexibacter arvalis TaxID=912552 RepID=A0A840IE93_9ACTN|nr:phage shock protein PspC (stress-responsive transcriptional regulator) [Conexibacter arvalis]
MTTETTGSQPQGASQPLPRRRLERSRGDRVIAGVCGGLARHLGVDPVLVRIVVLATVVFGGFGVVAYLAAWLMVPEEGAEKPLLGGARPRQTAQVAIVIGIALAAVGLLGVWADAGLVFGGWPLVLVLFGAAVVWFVMERDRDDAGAPAGTGAAAAAAGGEGAAGDLPGGLADGATPAPERRRGSFAVTAITAGAVCVVVGIVGALDATGAVDLGWGGVAALAIVATGVALVVSSFFGGARALVPLGIVLALLLGGTAAAGVSFNSGIGERDHRVLHGDDLRGRYELGVGHLQLDLRGIELARGTTRVEADLDVGMIEIVADDGRFLDAGGTRTRRDGQASGGVDVKRTIVVGDGDRRLEIDAHVGVGVIAVGDRPGQDDDWEWSQRTLPGSGPFAGVLR